MNRSKNEAYQQKLNGLNSQQRKAVEQIYGPVLVLAGPGTGKTHMLTTRIAHILEQTDASAKNILCLTFTENAAVEMRNRLQQLIGSESYLVTIATFHGFAQKIIDQNPELFDSIIQGRTLADDLQKALTFREVLRSQSWEYFRPMHDEFSEYVPFLMAMDGLKREHVSPQTLQETIPHEQERLECDPANFYTRKYGAFEKGDFKPNQRAKIDRKIGKLKEFCSLWEQYEQALVKNGFYDFNDLINWSVDQLQANEELRFDLQEQYQWILVDEYQDTNTAQNEIIWSLCDNIEDPNIFAVGDDDQSIYRFQGASIANIKDFRERFAKRTEITLEKNYRSLQSILDAAYGVVQNNPERANTDKKLIAQKKKTNQKQVFAIEENSNYSEIKNIVQTIRKNKEKGIPYKEMAVLVRKNREITDLARELPKFDIPVVAKGSSNIFENAACKWMIHGLELIHNPTDNEVFLDLMHAPFWNIPSHDLLRLSMRHANKNIPFVETLLSPSQTNEMPDPEVPSLFESQTTTEEPLPQALIDWGLFFANIRQHYAHMRPAALAEKFLHESGLGSWLKTHQKMEDWQCVRKYIEWIREQESSTESHLADILDRTKLHQELNIPIKPDPLPGDNDAVQIMTAHGSKGLEFEIVFVPGVHDKKWGNPRSKQGIHLPDISLLQKHNTLQPLASNTSSSRRLSQTEAQHTNSVCEQGFATNNDEIRRVSSQAENEEERRLFFVSLTRAKSEVHISYSNTDFSGREKTPSQFIGEIPSDIPTHIDNSESSIDDLLPIFFQHQEYTLSDTEKALVQERVQRFVWSASSLQTYLDCPRKFLYQNIYKFPRRTLPIMVQGVALHESLERFLRIPNNQQNETALIDGYKRALNGQNIDTNTKQQLEHDGEKILSGYFANKLQKDILSPEKKVLTEYNFGKHHPEIENIRITGTMDKIIFCDEKESLVRIVDYKSGKPKNIQKGERLWRQLVFYDLLARTAMKNQWKVETCELEFLSPDHNGKWQTKEYQVTDEDRQIVIDELKNAHQAIANLEFPVVDNPENDPDIEYWNHFGQHNA